MDEFGVRHQNGRITVHITGHPFITKWQAQASAERFSQDDDCDECGADHWIHEVVGRDSAPWRPIGR